MEFRILGRLEIADERGSVELAGARQRALLTLLLLRPNQAVSSDRLIEELWAGTPPRNAANALQAAVSRVRRAIGQDRLRAQPPGYVLELGPDELDLDRFERLAAAGRAALASGAPAEASASLARALELWNGPPLAEFAYEPFALPEIARLEELRLAAVEERIEADLAVGRHRQLVGELESLVAAHPLRERFRAELMLALYRSGRQADALARYQEGRRAAVDDLGIEPGRELKRLESAILQQDPSLDLASSPAPPPAAAPPAETQDQTRDGRKIVTVIFADVVESTALAATLDPERLRAVLERVLGAMADVLERHGGRVHSYIGDAIMGVFGVPSVREDDAIRALRAVVEIRDRVGELGRDLEQELGAPLLVRIGVDTGEVFVGGEGLGQPTVTGMVVNLAKRLEQAAPPGEALIGEGTFLHARHAATCEPVGEVDAKGAPGPVRAWQLLAVSADAPSVPRSASAPLVGRAAELERLRAAFDQCVAEASTRLTTVLGPPGIGKSRLVRELEGAVADDALVLRGRCLPYGEGITYWPLAEIVLQLAPGDPRSELASAVAGDELADVVVDRILAAVGAGGQPGPSEETHWAVRRLVEALSADRPVVLVLDDVHWAMPTFLDLIEYLVGFSTGPLLLVCMARDELVEARPSWAGGRSDREIVLLGPLAGSEPRDLVESLAAGRGTPLSDATLGRILDVGEGNPLFLEQLVAAQVEGSDAAGEPLVPATVQALLAARIDRLEHQERRLLERASVEGRVFHRRPLVELTPPAERDSLGASLMALVRKELLEPARPDVPDDDAFRFRHLLLRDAAYAALPKEARWELHRRFADWVESSAVLLLERDEIAGHHLEQAYRYASELGLGTAADREEVALRGSARLEAGAQRAAQRIDLPAAANLYERSSALLAADDPGRAPLLLGLGAALAELGGLDDAAAAFEEALVTADERTGAHVRVHQLLLRVQTEPERALAELEQVRAQTAPLFAQANDRLGLCKLGQLEGRVQWLRGRAGAAEEAWRAAAADARDAGSERDYSDILAWLASAALWGSTAVDEAIPRCEEIRGEVRADPYAEADAVRALAGLHAMAGRSELAGELLAQSRRLLEDRGRTVYSDVSHHEALVAMLAGRHDLAEAGLREGVARLQDMGERSFLATTAALLARALVQQGKHAEALEPVELAEEGAAADDLSSQVLWRSVKACVLAERGELEEAERLSSEAVAIADGTDWVNDRADAWLERAQVLGAAGRAEEAVGAARTARELYERKGNEVGAGRALAVEHPA